jgi:hypothetical protein
MLPLTTHDLLALLIVLASTLCLALVHWLSGNPKKTNIRLPSTTEAIDSLLQNSAESGKPVLLNLGMGFSPNPEIVALLGLGLQRMVVRRSLTADRPNSVGSGDGLLALVSQQVSRGLYHNALMPELFNMDQASLQALGPMANLASLLNMLPESKPSGLLLYGSFTPEYLLALDQVTNAGSLSMVGASAPTAQASLWLLADYSALGEDCFASASIRKPEKGTLVGLKTADIFRVLISIALLAAALLKVMGEF